jgi:transcriptional regulator with XRE-family HTH domain
MDIATTIRTARRKAGLSQRALAEKMSVAPSAVAQWETNVTKPTIDNRVDLASILSVPFADLLPEASGGHVESQDPQTIILVRKFEALPARVREAILMQVVATAESLEAGEKTVPAKK